MPPFPMSCSVLPACCSIGDDDDDDDYDDYDDDDHDDDDETVHCNHAIIIIPYWLHINNDDTDDKEKNHPPPGKIPFSTWALLRQNFCTPSIGSHTHFNDNTITQYLENVNPC